MLSNIRQIELQCSQYARTSAFSHKKLKAAADPIVRAETLNMTGLSDTWTGLDLSTSPRSIDSMYNISNFSTDTNVTYYGPSGRGKVPEAPLYLLVLATLFYVVIFLVGIIGNSLVIAVVIYGRNIRNAVNMYLINLCVADLLVMVVCMPPVLVELHTKDVWYFGEAMCKYLFHTIL